MFTILRHHLFFFFSSRRRHTRFDCDWSSDVCSSDLRGRVPRARVHVSRNAPRLPVSSWVTSAIADPLPALRRDRKSTRLNSSHSQISYAVFCLKKKKKTHNHHNATYTSHIYVHTIRY